MQILLSINILAVIGTSLLMMAIAIIWFSSAVFGGQWLRSIGKTSADISKGSNVFLLVGTFLSYLVLESALACLVLAAPLLHVTPLVLVSAVCVFVLAFIALPVIWERRSVLYYAIQAGYAATFIIGSMAVLHYWPW